MEDCPSQAPQSKAATSPKESSPQTSKTPPHPQASPSPPPEKSQPSPQTFHSPVLDQGDAPTAHSQASPPEAHSQSETPPHSLHPLHPDLAPSNQETPPPSKAPLPRSKAHNFFPPSFLSAITIFPRITFNDSSCREKSSANFFNIEVHGLAIFFSRHRAKAWDPTEFHCSVFLHRSRSQDGSVMRTWPTQAAEWLRVKGIGQ